MRSLFVFGPGAGRIVGAVVTAAVLLTGCGQRGPADPVHVAQQFAHAVQRRDSAEIVTLIDEQSAQELSVRAQRASDQVGGRRTVEPREILQVEGFDPLRQFSGAELVSQDAETAVVRLTDTTGQTSELTLVFEQETWHVQLPPPPRSSQ